MRVDKHSRKDDTADRQEIRYLYPHDDLPSCSNTTLCGKPAQIQPTREVTITQSACADFQLGLTLLVDFWQTNHEDAVLLSCFSNIHIYLFWQKNGA